MALLQANQMADYWANFIKTGDPNGEGLPTWTPYTQENRQVMELNYGPHMVDEPDADIIKMLTRYHQYQF